MKKDIALAICAAAVLAAGTANAEQSIDARLAALERAYLTPEKKLVLDPGTPKIDPRTISDDVAIRSGDWLLLTKKYENTYSTYEIDEPADPVRLSHWWRSLGDERLTNLILTALEHNRDLAQARSAVDQARAAVGISRSALLPWLDASGSWTNGDPSENGSQAARGSFNLYKLGIDASWELDFFGGNQANVSAARADLVSAHAALHSAWVSLAAEVAINYVSLCTLQERLIIANENLETQTATLEILTSLHESGLSDTLALNQAEYTREITRASIPPIVTAIEQTMNAIAILVGKTPGSLEMSLKTRYPVPEVNDISLLAIPAEALRRRPDIRAAEYAYIAQTARTKKARADLYPKFRLFGSIGLESFSTGSIFDGGSFGFSFGPSITWPIFHAGAIRRNIQVQSARAEQLLAAYESTVLRAVAEVRNAITAHEQDRARLKALTNGVIAARSALDVANDKYHNGIADFNNVINAQSALLTLQDQEVSCRGAITSDLIRLFKALGGGWEPLAEAEIELAKNAQKK